MYAGAVRQLLLGFLDLNPPSIYQVHHQKTKSSQFVNCGGSDGESSIGGNVKGGDSGGGGSDGSNSVSGCSSDI